MIFQSDLLGAIDAIGEFVLEARWMGMSLIVLRANEVK